MDSKELRGLCEAYSEVYVPVDEAVKGADPEMRKAASAERKAGEKRLPPSTGKGYANQQKQSIAFHDKRSKGRHIPGMTYSEEVDIFDVVLEFLQAEGFAETLEEAEWMMANVIDDEVIAIILGEGKKPYPAEKVKNSLMKKSEYISYEDESDRAHRESERGEKQYQIHKKMMKKEEFVGEGKKEFPHKKVDRQVYDAMDSGETAGDSGNSAKEKRDYDRAEKMRSVAAKHGGKSRVREEFVDEASYSAKAARAGKDIGKPGKAFEKIAKEAGKRYGSKERGEKVAGAVLAKLRAKGS